MLSNRRLILLSMVPSAAVLAIVLQDAYTEPKLDVPYVPTPQPVVEEMLEVAGVGPGDVVYDLGSGDGRIVIAAARRGARAVGVDLDPERVREARANARRAGVEERVELRQGDLFEIDLGPATVVTMYLLPGVNLDLQGKLERELRPGTRIVSHSFDMGAWKPDRTVEVDGRTIYYWKIPRATGAPAAR